VTPTDAHRSLARYLALALPDFEIRLALPEDTFARPWLMVTPSTPVANVARGSHFAELRQSFSVLAYPAETLDPESGSLEASGVAEQLVRALGGPGVLTSAYSSTTARGHPMRLPIWSYEGVALGEPLPEDREPGWMRVLEGPSVGVAPDPADDLAYRVTADLRVSWTRSMSVAFPQAVTQTVGATPNIGG
jgi:hypothetical protein